MLTYHFCQVVSKAKETVIEAICNFLFFPFVFSTASAKTIPYLSWLLARIVFMVGDPLNFSCVTLYASLLRSIVPMFQSVSGVFVFYLA